MRVFSCRSAVDVVPPAGPVQPRPRAPTVGAGPRPTAPVSHGTAQPRGFLSFVSVFLRKHHPVVT
ncbi:hypothetical protein OsJ_05208 [Oryza sativa Japonica Group]|uniref:Uncharacterized protein n=1 Tax=Oryza sativa subsp. japonica TaxID=39947 RepID=B9F283_ORYSJ|nr:hypothetical protein OsJ_05208 [Oryza sativa Japonica Group]